MENGVITDDIVNEDTRFITCASDKKFTDLSLTKTGDNDWGKRKIIHSIKVNIEKNTAVLYDDAVSFSIIKVKRSMFTESSIGSLVSNTPNWSLNQLIKSPQRDMFNTSFEFNDLMYDLPDDEDFALIQNIKFANNYLTTGSKKYAEATKPYVKYEMILYSNGYL